MDSLLIQHHLSHKEVMFFRLREDKVFVVRVIDLLMVQTYCFLISISSHMKRLQDGLEIIQVKLNSLQMQEEYHALMTQLILLKQLHTTYVMVAMIRLLPLQISTLMVQVQVLEESKVRGMRRQIFLIIISNH